VYVFERYVLDKTSKPEKQAKQLKKTFEKFFAASGNSVTLDYSLESPYGKSGPGLTIHSFINTKSWVLHKLYGKTKPKCGENPAGHYSHFFQLFLTR